MSKANDPAPRRVRVERNIYRRASGVLEIGWKDAQGVQRWATVPAGKGITAARRMRDELLADRHAGKAVPVNRRLTFADAADAWIAGPVSGLRPATRQAYVGAVEHHLRPRYARRRLDSITADEVAALERALKAAGLSAATRSKALAVLRTIYRYAGRRLGFAGACPVDLLEQGERPRVSAKRKVIFSGEQLEQTIAAAEDPYRTLFVVLAMTGARVSEALALRWGDVTLDGDEPELRIAWQLARTPVPDGSRELRPLKTDGSDRAVPIAPGLAAVLARHKLAAADSSDGAFVFVGRTGEALWQRNVNRALRAAQTAAVDEHGRPTFPILHETDDAGRPVKVPRNTLPTVHSLRHTVASRLLAAGESVDEIAVVLGHENANVTRAVYVHEITDTRRRAMRRDRMAAAFGGVLEAVEDGSLMEASAARSGPQADPRTGSNVRQLRRSS